jgi:hypothetical protein
VAAIKFLVHTDSTDIDINSNSYELGFFGNNGPGSYIAINTWNGTTYLVNTNEEAKIHCNNLKYESPTGVYIEGVSIPLLLQAVPNYQSTLNLRFEHPVDVQALVCRCRMYDRTQTTDDVPTGADLRLYELVHQQARQFVPLSPRGHDRWQDIGSGNWVDLSSSPGPSGEYGGTIGSRSCKQHDWYLGISVSPKDIGRRSNIGLEVSIEYL